jgi:hypothetical protein
MYCTTNPQMIAAEIATARRTIAKLEAISTHDMAQADALAAAYATLRAYCDCTIFGETHSGRPCPIHEPATYRFATTADAQRALRAVWADHKARLAAGVDYFESRDAYKAESDAITADAIDPAGRDVMLEAFVD